jgi:hypothetical protein
MLRIVKGSKVFSMSGLLGRRRSRQHAAGRRPGAYSYDLASLHIELLVAMAAVDGEIRSAEVDEVLGFIDRTSLDHDDIERLERHVRVVIAKPPELRDLNLHLSRFAGKSSLTRRIVNDLANVAAADAKADPRETRLLEFVCDALGVDRIRIHAPLGYGSDERPEPARAVRSSRVASQLRAHMAVQRTLRASETGRTR